MILTKDHTKTDATASCFLISEMLKFVQKDGLNCKNNTHVRSTYSSVSYCSIGANKSIGLAISKIAYKHRVEKFIIVA